MKRADGGCCITRPFSFLHFRCRKLQFPEAGRNAIKRWWLPKCKQLRKPIITGDNRSLPLSLSLSFLRISGDTARALFYKPGMEIERGGCVSISRRLLIHDYRPPRYSLPECKMATSAGIYVPFITSLVVLNSCRVFERPQLRGLHFYFIYS